jgi:hypothetical protein
MSDQTNPTAEITALALRKAAEAAEEFHIDRLDEMRAAFIARAVETEYGWPWNRRRYTREEAEQHWPEDHSRIGCFMGPSVFEAPRGSHWHQGRMERAASLIDLATTKSLHDIRIPEGDALFLRPYLNGERNA